MRLKKPDQKFLLFCAISMLTGILAGIFLAVKCRTGNGAAGIFSPYYLKEYAYLDIDRRKLMLIVAKERGKWLLLLWALGFSTVGRFCINLFPAVWGVIGTLFLAQAFAGMGIAGIGLGLLFQVPQILIYVPLFLWMMEEADKKSRQFAYLRKIGYSLSSVKAVPGINIADKHLYLPIPQAEFRHHAAREQRVQRYGYPWGSCRP